MSEAIVTNILLAIPLLLLVSIIFGEMFERLKLESVIGYILAGLILGPSILNLISPHLLENFAVLGIVLIMFLAGLKEENVVGIFTKKKTFFLGLSVLLITFLALFLFLMSPLSEMLKIPAFTPFQIIFIALAYSIVSLGVPVKLLLAKNLLSSKMGTTILNSLVANLIIGLGILTIITSLFAKSLTVITVKFLGTLFFIAIFVFLFKFISQAARRITVLRVEEAQFTLTIILLLIMSYSTQILGFSVVLGAFLAGVILSRTRFVETRAFTDRFKAISLGLFVPLFFAWIGLELKLLGSEGILANISVALILFFIAMVSKFAISYVYAKKNKIEHPGIISTSMLSLDAASLVIIFLAIKVGIFKSNLLLSIFAPSILFSTILLVVLFNIFSKSEIVSAKTNKKHN